jgi:hypothetical protein
MKKKSLIVNKLTASKEREIGYCTIIEIHSPEYFNEEWLKALYPDQYDHYRDLSAAMEQMLKSYSELKSSPLQH